MDRLRRWVLLSFASLLTAAWMPPRKKVTSVTIAANTDFQTASLSIVAKARPSTQIEKYLLEWGDGTVVDALGPPPPSATHTYQTAGTFTIRVYVWDSSGGSAWDAVNVGIILYTQPQPPAGGGPPADEYNYYCQGGGYAGTGTVRTVTTFTDVGVQDKLALSTHGDIVCLPAGTYTFNAAVGVGLDVLIIGAGIGNTVINSGAGLGYFWYVGVDNASRGHFRLAHHTLSGDTGGAAVQITTSGLTAPASGLFRIDHIHFNNPTGFASAIKHLFGAVWGVVDNCTFDARGTVLTHHQMGLATETYSGNMMAQIPTGFGGANFIFYEDNTIANSTTTDTMWMYDVTSGGGRAVWRYNDIYGACEFFSHWTRGNEIGMTAGEFYNNTWHFRAGDPRPADGMARFEAGTFLFYNNAFISCPDQPFIGIDDRREADNAIDITITRSGSTATAVATGGSHFLGGVVDVEIKGATQSEYNGFHSCTPTSVPGDTFTFTVSGTPATPATGTIKAYVWAGAWGACDGTKAWDGNAGDGAAPGWPCLGQIGRGYDATTSLDALVAGTVEQPSEPAYIWNNGEQAGCATGGSCTEMILAFATPAAYIKKTAHAVNGEVDFVENSGARPSYTAYTYPHPLTDDIWP